MDLLVIAGTIFLLCGVTLCLLSIGQLYVLLMAGAVLWNWMKENHIPDDSVVETGRLVAPPAVLDEIEKRAKIEHEKLLESTRAELEKATGDDYTWLHG